MNEDLQERFSRSRKAAKGQPATGQAVVLLIPQQLNPRVREYFEQPKTTTQGGAWLNRPEIPTSEEVLDTETRASRITGEVELGANKPKGKWASKDEYLGTHYELLREDAVRGLRQAVSQVKFTPTANEDAFNGSIGIYDKVHFCAIIPSTKGLAHRVTFSLGRVQKQILWEQSKRLMSGSLVVLTPTTDMFKTKAIVATVAARPLAGLSQNPSELDLFLSPEDREVDPSCEYVMVEDRGGFYEAHKHTMLGLQKMMGEPFPLNEHLVSVQKDIPPPAYVAEHPVTDMSSVMSSTPESTCENVDILRDWPQAPKSKLDSTQLDALKRILTKRLAIVQGPPGTGKTFVSTEAIRVLLANRKAEDPPIIVSCQTNHAVDQLLNLVAPYVPDAMVRLGARSKDPLVKTRTLYEVRRLTSENPLAGCMASGAHKKMKETGEQIKQLLLPLAPSKVPLDHNMLHRLGLLTERQTKSLELGASEWIQTALSNPNQSPFTIWLGKALVPVSAKQLPQDYGFQGYEEVELEIEQVKESEAENFGLQDDEFDSLKGEPIPIADNFTCRKAHGRTEDVDGAIAALKKFDLWSIPEAIRPAVYRYLQSQLKLKIREAVREKAKIYNEKSLRRRIGQWEKDEQILKEQKIIGCTTTGFSKYRGLIAALEPKIVLIEEAAETLEAPVTVTCVPSLQHLILVGDHRQLRPQCHSKGLENEDFWLNVSLFERLVNNGIPLTTLGLQRRMIPEIRRLLYPIYQNQIQDHPSVLDPHIRPDVPGMGGVNSLFLTHQWLEQTDDHMSKYNQSEADMITGFVEYLVFNGLKTTEITVLTFYNGQRKKIHQNLRKIPGLLGEEFLVKTIDSYQGEQNKVIILSLVRSNDRGQIGFLNVQNRICVALSRAQQGLYIFGNGMMLYGNKNNKWPGNKTWRSVINIMADRVQDEEQQKDRLSVEPINRVQNTVLPLRCANHGNVIEIRDANDWSGLYGGCQVPCEGTITLCGHKCTLPCHPFSHDKVICDAICGKLIAACGHICKEICGDPCKCKICSKERGRVDEAGQYEADDLDINSQSPQQLSNADSWTSFAMDEPIRYASAVTSSDNSRRSSPQKLDFASQSLIDAGLQKGLERLSLKQSARDWSKEGSLLD